MVAPRRASDTEVFVSRPRRRELRRADPALSRGRSQPAGAACGALLLEKAQVSLFYFCFSNLPAHSSFFPPPPPRPALSPISFLGMKIVFFSHSSNRKALAPAASSPDSPTGADGQGPRTPGRQVYTPQESWIKNRFLKKWKTSLNQLWGR